MSTFSISNISPAGALCNALDAARDSDLAARRHNSASGRSSHSKSHGARRGLAVRAAAAGMVVAGCILGAALVVMVAA